MRARTRLEGWSLVTRVDRPSTRRGIGCERFALRIHVHQPAACAAAFPVPTQRSRARCTRYTQCTSRPAEGDGNQLESPSTVTMMTDGDSTTGKTEATRKPASLVATLAAGVLTEWHGMSGVSRIRGLRPDPAFTAQRASARGVSLHWAQPAHSCHTRLPRCQGHCRRVRRIEDCGRAGPGAPAQGLLRQSDTLRVDSKRRSSRPQPVSRDLKPLTSQTDRPEPNSRPGARQVALMCQRRVVVKGTQATVRCRPPAFLLRSSVGMHWLGTLVLDR